MPTRDLVASIEPSFSRSDNSLICGLGLFVNKKASVALPRIDVLQANSGPDSNRLRSLNPRVVHVALAPSRTKAANEEICNHHDNDRAVCRPIACVPVTCFGTRHVGPTGFAIADVSIRCSESSRMSGGVAGECPGHMGLEWTSHFQCGQSASAVDCRWHTVQCKSR